MQENSSSEKHCHMRNSSFDTSTNRVRERKRRKAQRKKAQASYSGFCINWAVRKHLVESPLVAFLTSSLRYFGKLQQQQVEWAQYRCTVPCDTRDNASVDPAPVQKGETEDLGTDQSW